MNLAADIALAHRLADTAREAIRPHWREPVAAERKSDPHSESKGGHEPLWRRSSQSFAMPNPDATPEDNLETLSRLKQELRALKEQHAGAGVREFEADLRRRLGPGASADAR